MLCIKMEIYIYINHFQQCKASNLTKTGMDWYQNIGQYSSFFYVFTLYCLLPIWTGNFGWYWCRWDLWSSREQTWPCPWKQLQRVRRHPLHRLWSWQGWTGLNDRWRCACVSAEPEHQLFQNKTSAAWFGLQYIVILTNSLSITVYYSSQTHIEGFSDIKDKHKIKHFSK